MKDGELVKHERVYDHVAPCIGVELSVSASARPFRIPRKNVRVWLASLFSLIMVTAWRFARY